jgi:hypothetical protein
VGSASGLVEVGVSVEEQQAVAAAASERERVPEQDAAIAAEHDRKRTVVQDSADRVREAGGVVAQTARVEHARLGVDPPVEGRSGQPLPAPGSEPLGEPYREQRFG